MAHVADLSGVAFCRDTTAEVPPPLIGASTTVVDNKIWLYGGKLNSQGVDFTADIYCFNLGTAEWKRITPKSHPHLTPGARFFHSADVWRDYLVVFGGVGDSLLEGQEETVLSDVRLFDLKESRWLEAAYNSSGRTSSENPPDPSHQESSHITEDEPLSRDPNEPLPRFAHLSKVCSDKLFIIGGQGMNKEWLNDIHVFDLEKRRWIAKISLSHNCGIYRSVAVAGEFVVRTSLTESLNPRDDLGDLALTSYSYEPTLSLPLNLYLYSDHVSALDYEVLSNHQ